MIGIDLVHIPEFMQQVINGGDTFIRSAFSAIELQQDDPAHLAGLWAAKEAVTKAAGIGAGRWLDITITLLESGGMIASVDDRQFEISISHHGDYAVAVAYG